MSNRENRPLHAVRETPDLPRAAVHSPTCLCGCALATYATDPAPDPAPQAAELRGRAA